MTHRCNPQESSAADNEFCVWIPTDAYEMTRVEGFRVYISPHALAQEPARTTAVLAEIRRQLQSVHQSLPPDQLEVLLQTAFWIELDNPKSLATFHPSQIWLRRHDYNPDKAGSIEIPVSTFLRPDASPRNERRVVWHELAHAYQFAALGKDYPELMAAYQNILDRDLYRQVPHFEGSNRDAYARTNATEYFAELTETYFGHNETYPFNRCDLFEYDVVGYRLIEHIWGVEGAALDETGK